MLANGYPISGHGGDDPHNVSPHSGLRPSMLPLASKHSSPYAVYAQDSTPYAAYAQDSTPYAAYSQVVQVPTRPPIAQLSIRTPVAQLSTRTPVAQFTSPQSTSSNGSNVTASFFAR